MNSKKDIPTLIFWPSLLILIAYISWTTAVLSTIIAFSTYAFITYILYLAWKKIRKQENVKILEFFELFAYKSAISISIVSVLVWWFIYYNNEISPAAMPTYYLSNWEKQVTFQSMIHIANPDFYERIKQDILFAKQDNYVYFFEWVKPWTPESHTAFNEALWVEFNPELYKNFSELYWVVAQDNSQFLWLENDLDFNVDMNMDTIMQLYKQKVSPNESKIPSEIIDANAEIIKTLSSLNPIQKKILVYVNQAILNFFTKNDSIRNAILENLWNQDIFSIILDERNVLIADEISSSQYNKIYITYGLLHFQWVFELLKKQDPNWILHHTDYLFPIQ